MFSFGTKKLCNGRWRSSYMDNLNYLVQRSRCTGAINWWAIKYCYICIVFIFQTLTEQLVMWIVFTHINTLESHLRRQTGSLLVQAMAYNQLTLISIWLHFVPHLSMSSSVLGCENKCISNTGTHGHTHQFIQLGQTKWHSQPITQCPMGLLLDT